MLLATIHCQFCSWKLGMEGKKIWQHMTQYIKYFLLLVFLINHFSPYQSFHFPSCSSLFWQLKHSTYHCKLFSNGSVHGRNVRRISETGLPQHFFMVIDKVGKEGWWQGGSRMLTALAFSCLQEQAGLANVLLLCTSLKCRAPLDRTYLTIY